jgi:CheY-like chemotaxis protein
VKGRVLIIDDEPEVRRNLTVGLIQENYQVVACPNGISAIHELSASRGKGIGYDYLVTDIFMPDIDGMKILKVIKNEFPDLPVLIITAFGDDKLKFTALAEQNTGYLDKPFEISEMVDALEKLSPGVTTLDTQSDALDKKTKAVTAESISAYITIKITDNARSMEIFNELQNVEGVYSCDAVWSDIDIIILAQASSQQGIQKLFDRVKQVRGIDVVSLAPVERPKLDLDVSDFIEIYKRAVKQSAQKDGTAQPGIKSYIIVDIDKNAIQQIFTSVFFIDEVIFCDIIEGGGKLVGMVTNQGMVGTTPRIIEKLKEIPGVLRVREAKIIKLSDN